jgi:hypothetical protein
VHQVHSTQLLCQYRSYGTIIVQYLKSMWTLCSLHHVTHLCLSAASAEMRFSGSQANSWDNRSRPRAVRVVPPWLKAEAPNRAWSLLGTCGSREVEVLENYHVARTPDQPFEVHTCCSCHLSQPADSFTSCCTEQLQQILHSPNHTCLSCILE